jgi:hypothetical protein
MPRSRLTQAMSINWNTSELQRNAFASYLQSSGHTWQAPTGNEDERLFGHWCNESR